MNYHIITFGCQMNKTDSERIASFLEKMNHQQTAKLEEADIVILNMCSIRQSAVDRAYGKAKNLVQLKKTRPNLKIILTGCVLESDRKKFEGKIVSEIWDNKNYFKMPPKRNSEEIAYIPVSNGCNNFCSYCAVPFTRGPLQCRNHQEILEEAKEAIKKGAKEIWLLGQNVNDYLNKKKGESIKFADLIKMIDNLPGDFTISFISPHPKNFSDELINTLAQCHKFSQYLHLPLQSGDNQILKKMNRPYTAGQYKKLVEKIRKKIPGIFLSTDIIVGFPGETEKQFENTKKFFEKMDFDMAYISKYSIRPGTAAAKMKDHLSPKEKKRRWNILNNILKKKWGEK